MCLKWPFRVKKIIVTWYRYVLFFSQIFFMSTSICLYFITEMIFRFLSLMHFSLPYQKSFFFSLSLRHIVVHHLLKCFSRLLITEVKWLIVSFLCIYAESTHYRYVPDISICPTAVIPNGMPLLIYCINTELPNIEQKTFIRAIRLSMCVFVTTVLTATGSF
jgi:hypothetical protein